MFKHSDEVKKIARALHFYEQMNAPQITRLLKRARVGGSLPSVYAWIEAPLKSKLTRSTKKRSK